MLTFPQCNQSSKILRNPKLSNLTSWEWRSALHSQTGRAAVFRLLSVFSTIELRDFSWNQRLRRRYLTSGAAAAGVCVCTCREQNKTLSNLSVGSFHRDDVSCLPCQPQAEGHYLHLTPVRPVIKGLQTLWKEFADTFKKW